MTDELVVNMNGSRNIVHRADCRTITRAKFQIGGRFLPYIRREYIAPLKKCGMCRP